MNEDVEDVNQSSDDIPSQPEPEIPEPPEDRVVKGDFTDFEF